MTCLQKLIRVAFLPPDRQLKNWAVSVRLLRCAIKRGSFGAITPFHACAKHFRFAPDCGRLDAVRRTKKRVMNGLFHGNWTTRHLLPGLGSRNYQAGSRNRDVYDLFNDPLYSA